MTSTSTLSDIDDRHLNDHDLKETIFTHFWPIEKVRERAMS